MSRLSAALIVLLASLTLLASPASAASGTWRYRYLIEEAAARYDLPAGLIQATMYVESGGDPGAYSSSGAIGLMQVMPFWFSASENPWDWRTNVLRGAYVLQQCKLATGRWWQPGDDWVETINCYYWGHPVYYPTWYSNRVRTAWIDIAAHGG